MKRKIILTVELFFLIFYKLKFIVFLNYKIKNKKIVFVDIDNTIADTWPTLIGGNYKNDFDRHSRIPLFSGMKNFINSNYSNESYTIIYLSARSFRLYNVTNNWLHGNNISYSNSLLILVPKLIFKLYFLKKALNKKFEIVYIDDLSYNHERNDIKFYDSIINEVKKLKVNYIGFEEINKINNVLQNN